MTLLCNWSRFLQLLILNKNHYPGHVKAGDLRMIENKKLQDPNYREPKAINSRRLR